jgi:hypothetical protein
MDARQLLKRGPRQFVGREDLAAGPLELAIADVRQVVDDRDGDGRTRLQLVFDDGRRFTLNTTNAERVIDALGAETEDWIGSRVTLDWDPRVELRGRAVGGVRVRQRRSGRLEDDVRASTARGGRDEGSRAWRDDEPRAVPGEFRGSARAFGRR